MTIQLKVTSLSDESKTKKERKKERKKVRKKKKRHSQLELVGHPLRVRWSSFLRER
jgi:hypothetical protein